MFLFILLESEQKCPYPECDTVYARSALLKRHLLELHNITSAQDISVQLPNLEAEKKRIMLKIKSEPVDPEDMSNVQNKDISSDSANKKLGDLNDSSPEEGQQEKKVPPLRVKLPISTSPTTQSSIKDVLESSSPSQLHLTSTNGLQSKSAKDLYGCANCNFKSNNSYISKRHRKSCDKKRKPAAIESGDTDVKDFKVNGINESTPYEDDSVDYMDTSSGAIVHEPEDSIEVPVEFDGDAEEITNISSTSNDGILDVHMDVVASNQNSSEDPSQTNEEESFDNNCNVDNNDTDDSHCSEDGDELEIGPEDEMDESNEPPEEYEATDCDVGSLDDKRDQDLDSENDNTEFDTIDEGPSDSETLPLTGDGKHSKSLEEQGDDEEQNLNDSISDNE